MEVSSDGEGRDWNDGRTMASSVLERRVPIPFNVEPDRVVLEEEARQYFENLKEPD